MKYCGLCCFIFSLIYSFSAVAKEETQDIDRAVGSLVIYFENDLFYNTDRYNTNSVQMRAISPALNNFSDSKLLPNFLNRPIDFIQSLQNKNTTQYNVSIGMGHSIYTPKDTDAGELQKHDRPYAGYLYGFMALHAKQERMMDTLELALGIVGPSALGEQVQNEVHRIRDFDTVNGWDNQLSDEPTVKLSWARNYRLHPEGIYSGWNWDALPYHTVTLGNALTQATIGTELRFGLNIPPSFATSLIKPSSSIKAPNSRGNDYQNNDFGVYFFAGLEGRAVAHNILLDGNTWKDSHSVEKRNFVREINFGIAMIINNVQIAYHHVYLSKEFKGQEDGQNYGAISVNIPF